jgi:hypothetical protein
MPRGGRLSTGIVIATGQQNVIKVTVFTKAVELAKAANKA